MKARPLAAVLLLTVASCDPPCEPYWKLACEKCDDTGCRVAKERAAKLSKGGTCDAETGELRALMDQGSKDLACSMPIEGALPPVSMFAAYTCRGDGDAPPSSLSIGARSITVEAGHGPQVYPIVQMTADWLNVKVSSSMQTTCKLSRVGDALSIDCVTPLGTLGPRLDCAKKDAAKRDEPDPRTCASDNEGKTRCSADGKRVLACRDGKVVVEQWCRGPKGCAPSGDFTSCDETIARAGDPCTDTFGVSGPKTEDGTAVLSCVSGTWQLVATPSPSASSSPR